MNKKTIIIVILLLITTGILGYCIVNKKEDVNVKELVEDIESIRENDKIIHAKEKEPYTIPSTYYGDGYSITVSLNRDSSNYFIYVNNEEIYHYTRNRNIEEYETGYFYREPSSVEDITYIDIDYNNGKDYVQIVDNEIRYGGFDENGNYKYENVKEDGEFAQDIKKYIYKNNLKYMDREYSSPNKANWELTINVIGGGCSIGGKDEQPEWFNVLLNKLEVDKYKNT